MSDESNHFTKVGSVSLADENALLRAALADAQERLHALEEHADSDPLTGLASAKRFEAELERVAGHAARHGTPAAVLTIDIKGLAEINERHGRFGGDAALLHVARLLGGLIRTTDVLARTGGGQFGLLLDHLDHNSAIDAAERLTRCIAAEPADLGAERAPVEARIAVTGLMPGDSAKDVAARAAANLTRVKQDD